MFTLLNELMIALIAAIPAIHGISTGPLTVCFIIHPGFWLVSEVAERHAETSTFSLHISMLERHAERI